MLQRFLGMVLMENLKTAIIRWYWSRIGEQSFQTWSNMETWRRGQPSCKLERILFENFIHLQYLMFSPILILFTTNYTIWGKGNKNVPSSPIERFSNNFQSIPVCSVDTATVFAYHSEACLGSFAAGPRVPDAVRPFGVQSHLLHMPAVRVRKLLHWLELSLLRRGKHPWPQDCAETQGPYSTANSSFHLCVTLVFWTTLPVS